MANVSLSVLIIEDDAGVLKSIVLALRRCAWTIQTTMSPKEGVALAKSTRPDVIVCDAGMPELSGPQVITILKADPVTEGIPIILMTGVADAHMFSDVPWTSFLAKPFGAKELRDAIEAAALRVVPSSRKQEP